MRLFFKQPKKPAEPSDILLKLSVAKDGIGQQEMVDLLTDLWGILTQQPRSKISGELAPHISFEIRAKAGRIDYFIWLNPNLKDKVTSEIIKRAPKLEINVVADDYSRRLRQNGVMSSAELKPLLREDSARLPSFRRAESIRNYLKTITRHDEEIWLQLLLRPKQSSKPADNLYRVKLRVVCLASDQANARFYIHNVAVVSRIFRVDNLNFNSNRQLEYHARLFIDSGFTMSSDEIASIFNFSDPLKTETDPSPFEKLLAEAESKRIVKKTSKKKSTKVKSPPKGIVRLTKQASTKAGVGKLATKSLDSPEALPGGIDEVVVKLH